MLAPEKLKICHSTTLVFLKLRSTIDRLVFTALHWFRTDFSTVLAVFTTKSFQWNACLPTKAGRNLYHNNGLLFLSSW